MPLYLGLDSSTQSLSAIVLDSRRGPPARGVRVLAPVRRGAPALPARGTACCRATIRPTAASPPVMWAEALDVMMARLAQSGLDLSRLAAISGSAQQHGSVYLNARAAASAGQRSTPRGRSPSRSARCCRGTVAPIWMDSSTSRRVRGDRGRGRRRPGAGAADRLARVRALHRPRRSGSSRRRIRPRYAATDRIHLVSSFLASLLTGGTRRSIPATGPGMNLMDLAACQWWPPAVDATAPGLAVKLPAIAPASTVVGTLSPYWQKRHGLPAGESDRVVRRQPVQPDRHRAGARRPHRRVARARATSIFGLMRRAARRSHRDRARVRRADRRRSWG